MIRCNVRLTPEQKTDALLRLSAGYIVLQALFHLFESADPAMKSRIAAKIVATLTGNVQLEEELLYTTVNEVQSPGSTALVRTVRANHCITRALIEKISQAKSRPQFVYAWVRVLAHEVGRHIAVVEASLFPLLQPSDRNLREPDSRLALRTSELTLIRGLETARFPSPRSRPAPIPVETPGERSSQTPDVGQRRLRLVSKDGPWFVEEYRLSKH